MTKSEYIQHWNYFCSLAANLNETKDYVYHGVDTSLLPEIKLIHGKVYSDRFKQIILLTAAEFEVMCKALCISKGKRVEKIIDISENVLNLFPRIINTEVITLFWQGKPLKNWELNDEKHVEGIEWWQAYNDLKHSKVGWSYANATLQQAVMALACLYIINLYAMVEFCGDMDMAQEYPNCYFRSMYINENAVIGGGLLPDYGDKAAGEDLWAKWGSITSKDKQG